jgi:HNH endonuclease
VFWLCVSGVLCVFEVQYRMARESNPYPRAWLDGKAVRIHRLLAQEVLERELEPGEVVHHRNHDKTDNSPGNLRVLPSQRHHMVLEHLERRRARGIEPLFDAEEILERVER